MYAELCAADLELKERRVACMQLLLCFCSREG